ncbi:MAG: HaeII family restriction endonuclease [Oscillospiraceae bacterium]|nr:HaeII family restriction endonuclease [Oscillospiraceae bacterium]
MNKNEAKAALDSLIRKSRVHLYKPIQIAEILYYARTEPGSINLANLEEYRNRTNRNRAKPLIISKERASTIAPPKPTTAANTGIGRWT